MLFATMASTQLKYLRTPILASILSDRPATTLVVGAAVVHTVLVIGGWPSWVCPLREYLGIPCPGCGLSRAIAALFRGDWVVSLTFHVFAPFFVCALGLMVGVLLLPPTGRNWLVKQIDYFERLTGATAILLIGLVVYWFIRLIFFHETFIKLIVG